MKRTGYGGFPKSLKKLIPIAILVVAALFMHFGKKGGGDMADGGQDDGRPNSGAHAGDGRQTGESRSNTETPDAGSSPPAGSRFPWAELPATPKRESVIYVTHFVSADGKKDASADEPGRVRNYSIAFDTRRRQPLWVAAPMHRWYRSPRNTDRTNYWWWDPAVPVDAQPNLERSYRRVAGGGNYSRGHMIASADRLREWALNAQTFYYTNIAPQIHEGFNEGLWNELEQRVQRWGDAASDTLYVVTGSAFLGDGEGGGTGVAADGYGNRIPVPSHFYKVLLSSKSSTGRPVGELRADELRAVGFWIEHTPEGGRLSAEHMMSVAEIEKLVGEEFFPILSREARAVKQSFDAGDWGMRR